VAVARNYITGPTVLADGDKLRQVFATSSTTRSTP